MNLHDFDIVIFDFDGVIKESVGAKGDAYKNLFRGCSEALRSKIERHHLNFGGMSRYEKIPLYLSWAFGAENVNQQLIESYLNRFQKITFGVVVSSPWVPGVVEFIHSLNKRSKCYLVTATPDEEIAEILRVINLNESFCGVYGASMSKSHAIQAILGANNLKAGCEQVVFVGDSETDMVAAVENRIRFVLRKTSSNTALLLHWEGWSIEDFTFATA